MFDVSSMRTTLDIAEDVLAAAKELGRLRGKTAGQVITELARRGLQRDTELEMRNGIKLLPAREGAGVVTPEHINRLLDETG